MGVKSAKPDANSLGEPMSDFNSFRNAVLEDDDLKICHFHKRPSSPIT